MRQRQALTVMMSGESVFLTGAPGSGKTYVLKQFVDRALNQGKQVVVTASTGIAASHIGGTTIHSWSGLGILDQLNKDDLLRLSGSDRLIKRYRLADILVIDEVSMLHGQRLNMINQLAKRLRGDDRAFGGLQVVLVGDLFQLPPVNRGAEPYDFIHLSDAWHELNPNICYLTEQHRQQINDGLLDLLEAMRRDEVSEEVHGQLLQARLNQKPSEEIVVTKLYSHNLDVDAINQRHLKMLPAKSMFYRMHTKGRQAKLEQLAKSLLTPELLELKIGAEVMFVANNFAEGYVNGSRGQVIHFENDTPVVRLTNGRKIYVAPNTWTLSEDGKVRAEIIQLPLRLAWAITIHKSQGMSLDAAEIDLSKTFTPGMGYVALSRVRSIDGLYLQGINQVALAMHPQIYRYDYEIRKASTELSLTVSDIVDEAEVKKAIVDEILYEKLKQWRVSRAQSDHVPPYIVAHNTTLSAIATIQPTSTAQLTAVTGLGARKIETYGQDILAIVNTHLADT